jgi:pSer/pThr/pTyr-binding forkhead associated (FHA) protein
MPYLQVNDKQVQLRLGETRIGVGGQVEVRLPVAPGGAGGVLAIVDFGRDSHVAIRRGVPDSVVRVNGVQLGAEPTPLIHGDKIEIIGVELYFGDDRKGGSTQFISSANVPDLARLRAPVPLQATAVTGGRVISLVDGREYPVGMAGLVFGRDASCDVVIPSSEVSRRHAEIVAGDSGYVVTDTSTNGLFVNGDRVEGMQILGRADILRIGPEEFRFYADTIAVEGAAGRAGAPGAANGPAAPPPTPVAASRPAPTPAMIPAAEEAVGPAIDATKGALRGAIAVLEVVSSGVLRGLQYPVKAILAHVGRGEHNDVVIPEESVSDSHAKLQRRDGVWYITDVGSTNGTYVAGRRIAAEERLGQTADLRLGGVKLTFSTVAVEPVTGARGATREFSSALAADAGRRAAAAREASAAEREPISGAGQAGVGGRGTSTRGRNTPPTPTIGKRWIWVVVAVLVLVGAVVYFIKGQ